MLWAENQIHLCAFLLFSGRMIHKPYTFHEKEILHFFPLFEIQFPYNLVENQDFLLLLGNLLSNPP